MSGGRAQAVETTLRSVILPKGCRDGVSDRRERHLPRLEETSAGENLQAVVETLRYRSG